MWLLEPFYQRTYSSLTFVVLYVTFVVLINIILTYINVNIILTYINNIRSTNELKIKFK